MRFTRDRQDFVRPHLGVIVKGNIWRHPPVARLLCRHFVNQLFLKWLDLRLRFTFWQPTGHLREKRVYRVIVPKRMEIFLADTSASWRFITQFQRKHVSAFISKG